MKLLHCWLCLLLLLCSGCATSSLHDAAHRTRSYWGGAVKPQAYLSAKGELTVFEMGLYGVGDSREDPRDSWHHIDLPLNTILHSLTNGQTSVEVRVKPKPTDMPDQTVLLGSGFHPIPTLFVKLPSDSVLPEVALVPRLEPGGTNYGMYCVLTDRGVRDASLIAYLERQPPQMATRQALLYLADQNTREIWVWCDRDGMVNGNHFVVLHLKYPNYTRWYLYAFTPVTLAVDIVTFPIQAVVFVDALRHTHLW
jgi:hypothetical protein